MTAYTFDQQTSAQEWFPIEELFLRCLLANLVEEIVKVGRDPQPHTKVAVLKVLPL